ncbi:uncharacterized protein LOC127376699 isoform X1 [Xyrichtys novacula]|uniref:Uncharacterized protein LOC127376699 isoform X1 n=1 Tax=Xyrichtys novacula TaxID=13765 RepID=A0AAV1GGL8_XYRNO|nr:uncharacterized protein LOC127376699 isoform X1 [Xyrichtys novacula]
MATKTSSKFDHITDKVLIRSGSPNVYQLKPKKQEIETKQEIGTKQETGTKQEIGTLTKITLGKKNPNKTNRTILLVGETGTGKSALINVLVNYAMGVKWEDDVWFEIAEEEEKQDQTKSRTLDVKVYEIFGFEDQTLPYSLTIIDTPGFGDTREDKQDDAVGQRLFQLFSSEGGVREMNVVGLVLKASENRLTDRQRYVFDSMVSLFGKNMKDNIIALITHSDGCKPKNALKALEAANIPIANDGNNEPVYFWFNNRQNQDRNEDMDILEFAEKITTEQIKKFFDFLEKTPPQDLTKTVEVLKTRIRLTACTQNLQERVQLIARQQNEIQQIQEALKKHQEEMRRNENFTVEVDEVYKEKERIDGGRWFLRLFYEGAVTCNICEENCHYPCTVAWSPKHCEVMKDGRCTSCTNKCPAADHVKEEWRYVIKTRKVKKTLQDVKEKCERSRTDHEEKEKRLKDLKETNAGQEDVKEKFEKSKTTCDEITDLLEALKSKAEELQRDKDRWLEESFQHVLKLEQIALNTNSLSTHVHLDFLIKGMKEKGETEKVQKLEEMKRREDEGIRAGLRYYGLHFGNRLVNAGKKVLDGINK